MKKIIIALCVIVVLVGGFYAFNAYIYKEKQGNTDVMSEALLEDGSWVWLYSELPGGKMVTAPLGKFVLTLKDGDASSTTDCNAMRGSYVRDGEILSFTPFASTKMYCEGSVETEYARQIGLTTSHTISSNQLRLILNRDAGVMVFEHQPAR